MHRTIYRAVTYVVCMTAAACGDLDSANSAERIAAAKRSSDVAALVELVLNDEVAGVREVAFARLHERFPAEMPPGFRLASAAVRGFPKERQNAAATGLAPLFSHLQDPVLPRVFGGETTVQVQWEARSAPYVEEGGGERIVIGGESILARARLPVGSASSGLSEEYVQASWTSHFADWRPGDFGRFQPALVESEYLLHRIFAYLSAEDLRTIAEGAASANLRSLASSAIELAMEGGSWTDYPGIRHRRVDALYGRAR